MRIPKKLHPLLGSRGGLERNTYPADKIQAVSNFLVPSTMDNVRSFLGLAGYYHAFIRNFSQIASPLNQLLRKGSTFHWDAPQQKSSEEPKDALTTAPVLQFSNCTKPFTPYTDASLSSSVLSLCNQIVAVSLALSHTLAEG